MPPPTNGLAIAGLLCSILGILTAGILCPIGVILSLVALGRPYGRGVAVAGLLIGLLGSCGGLALVILALTVGLVVVAAAVGIFMFTQSEKLELSADMAKIAHAVERYKEENHGTAPAALSLLNIETSATIDPWGHPYQYVLTEKDPGYDIISDGPDGKSGNADDVQLNRLDKYWEHAMDDFEAKLKEYERQRPGAHTQPATQPLPPAPR
jgi:hypothetical protein